MKNLVECVNTKLGQDKYLRLTSYNFQFWNIFDPKNSGSLAKVQKNTAKFFTFILSILILKLFKRFQNFPRFSRETSRGTQASRLFCEGVISIIHLVLVPGGDKTGSYACVTRKCDLWPNEVESCFSCFQINGRRNLWRNKSIFYYFFQEKQFLSCLIPSFILTLGCASGNFIGLGIAKHTVSLAPSN